MTLSTLDELHQHGVGFLSLEERFDLSTNYGWLMFNTFAGMAQFYSMNLASEVRKGQEARAREGLHATHIAYGYRRAGDKRTPAEPDEGGDWEGLQELIRLALGGYTSAEIADHLNACGYRLRSPARVKAGTIRPFTRNSVNQIRANVFYRPYQPGDDRGTVILNGAAHRGRHRAACTWDEWQAMQEMAQGRRRAVKRGGRYASTAEARAPLTAEFRGLISCAGCGYRLYVTYSFARKGDAERYERYYCVAHERNRECPYAGMWARAEDVRAAWVEWLAQRVTLPDGWREEARIHAAQMAEGYEEDDAIRVLREREIWERKREAAIRLYADGERDREWYEARKAECDAQLAELLAQARGADQQATRLIDAGVQLEGVVDLWRAAVEELRLPLNEPVAELGPRRAALVLEMQRQASMVIAPLGLVVRPFGRRGLYHRHQNNAERERSCELEQVTLRAPFIELLTVVAASSHEAV